MTWSIFDGIPMQKHFRETVGVSIGLTKEYQRLHKEITVFLRGLGKNLLDVKDEIKRYTFGKGMARLVQSQREELKASYTGKFNDFARDYETAWHTHDSFSVNLGSLLHKLRTGRLDRKTFIHESPGLLNQAVQNDIQLHLYTFLLQDMLKEELREQERATVLPFEFFVNEDALLLSGKEFAQKYAYGDSDAASHLRKKVTGKTLIELGQIAEQAERNYRTEKKGENFQSVNRLAHWEVFEEPRRRFSALYGIFDYIFRETLFQSMRGKVSHPKGVSCALDIPLERFLRQVEDNAK